LNGVFQWQIDSFGKYRESENENDEWENNEKNLSFKGKGYKALWCGFMDEKEK
jgi:hypothetical protein